MKTIKDLEDEIERLKCYIASMEDKQKILNELFLWDMENSYVLFKKLEALKNRLKKQND